MLITLSVLWFFGCAGFDVGPCVRVLLPCVPTVLFPTGKPCPYGTDCEESEGAFSEGEGTCVVAVLCCPFYEGCALLLPKLTVPVSLTDWHPLHHTG